MTIGDKIRQRRMALGWSLRDLAFRAGYKNQSTIARIESGEVDLPASKIKMFSEVLGVDLGYLFDFHEEVEKNPVGMAERHFEMIVDEDLNELFEYYKHLDKKQKKVVLNLVMSLAESEA